MAWAGRLVLGQHSRHNLAHQTTRLTVGGWDIAGKEAIAAEADMAVVASELDGGSSGGDILQQAFGERHASLAHTVPPNAEGRAPFRVRARSSTPGTRERAERNDLANSEKAAADEKKKKKTLGRRGRC